MYLLGVLCLVSFTAALPYSEPRTEEVGPNDPALDPAASELEIDAQKGGHEEKNEEDREELPAEYTITPPHLIETPHREVIIELYKVDRYSEREDDPKDKIIPIPRVSVSIGPLLGAVSSVISGAASNLLPALIALIEKVPFVGEILWG